MAIEQSWGLSAAPHYASASAAHGPQLHEMYGGAGYEKCWVEGLVMGGMVEKESMRAYTGNENAMVATIPQMVMLY